jgi:endothelin-converting enzyme/putative endopeptidase
MAKWRFEEDLADLNKPVDKTRWGMSPQTVNAYYNASYNEIVFPAILQPPFLPS